MGSPHLLFILGFFIRYGFNRFTLRLYNIISHFLNAPSHEIKNIH